MGTKASKLFGRNECRQTLVAPSVASAGTGDLPYSQLPSHVASHQALTTLAAASLAAIAAPLVQIAHWPSQHLPIEKLRSVSSLTSQSKPALIASQVPSSQRKCTSEDHAAQVPVYAQPLSAPTTVDTAVSVVRDLLETVKEASDSFAPLKTALGLFLKVWDVYDVRQSIRPVATLLMHAAAHPRRSRRFHRACKQIIGTQHRRHKLQQVRRYQSTGTPRGDCHVRVCLRWLTLFRP